MASTGFLGLTVTFKESNKKQIRSSLFSNSTLLPANHFWLQENYEILKTEENVHALTGALKLFLRELIEPVIPWLVSDFSKPGFRHLLLLSFNQSVRELLEAINSRDTETIKMRRIKLIIERFLPTLRYLCENSGSGFLARTKRPWRQSLNIWQRCFQSCCFI